jgi:hypothetical protein
VRAWLLALLGLPVVVGAGFVAVPAAAAGTPKPAIVSLVASPRTLPAEGGTIRLTVRVRNATRCTFRHQPTPFAALRADAVVRCAAGRASRAVTIVANPYRRTVTLRFDVRADGRSGRAVESVTVVQAAAPAPLGVLTTSLGNATNGTPYSATLAAAGGTPPYTWSLASGALPAGLTLSSNGTITGTPAGAGSSLFSVTATDASGRTATSSLSLTVTGVQLAVASLGTSTNWSGYVAEGNSFTSVAGTFTIPTVTSAGSTTSSTAEWVGVDGFADGNADLIQAGVAENVDRSGGVEVYAWWEILPASETRIDSVPVAAGDTVTVTIQQVSAGTWSIQLVDVTKNQSFTTTQSYAGKGLSAEWIVEAASTGLGRVLTLGRYSPNVMFTGIGWAGSATGFRPIQMQQRSGVVSVPSGLSADQSAFVVAYGSAAPNAPS